jgi:hypothetical protein
VALLQVDELLVTDNHPVCCTRSISSVTGCGCDPLVLVALLRLLSSDSCHPPVVHGCKTVVALLPSCVPVSSTSNHMS